MGGECAASASARRTYILAGIERPAKSPKLRATGATDAGTKRTIAATLTALAARKKLSTFVCGGPGGCSAVRGFVYPKEIVDALS
jgi:hypothetical protein